MLALIVLLQAVAGPPAPVPPRPPSSGRCAPGDPGDVNVCGRNDDAYRLKPLPDRYDEPALPKAETNLFGKVKASAETEGASVGGAPSNRVMMRFRIPF